MDVSHTTKPQGGGSEFEGEFRIVCVLGVKLG